MEDDASYITVFETWSLDRMLAKSKWVEHDKIQNTFFKKLLLHGTSLRGHVLFGNFHQQFLLIEYRHSICSRKIGETLQVYSMFWIQSEIQWCWRWTGQEPVHLDISSHLSSKTSSSIENILELFLLTPWRKSYKFNFLNVKGYWARLIKKFTSRS